MHLPRIWLIFNVQHTTVGGSVRPQTPAHTMPLPGGSIVANRRRVDAGLSRQIVPMMAALSAVRIMAWLGVALMTGWLPSLFSCLTPKLPPSRWTDRGFWYANRENCITDAGRYNLCFSKASDVLSNLSAEELNATYSSLSSSSPSASSYTFNPTKSGSQTTSSPSTTSATTTTENPASTSSGQSRETIVVGSGSHSPSTSLPGGAIGGIVAGVIVALIIALGALYFFLKRNRSQPNPAVGAYPPGPTYTAPPPDRILAAEGKSASSEIAPSKPIYKTGYTKHAYEADTRQTYEADGNVVTQVHEAGGLNRHELAGRWNYSHFSMWQTINPVVG
jgi:hypothetical protein